MKVKTSGFALDFQSTTIFDFLRYLKKNVSYVKGNRILVVDELEGTDFLWGGYLLHYRPEKIMPKVKLTSNEIETLLDEIKEKDVYHGEFNFFLINTSTRKGLFQTHAKTSGWFYFSSWLGHRFEAFRKETKNKDAWFVPSPLFTQGTFKEFLEKVDRIKNATIATSHYEVAEESYQALSGETSRHIEQFIFYKKDKPNWKKIRKALLSIYTKAPREMKVIGLLNGDDVPFSLADNLEVFYRQDYEQWMRNLKFANKDIRLSVNNSQTIKDLIQIYKETLPLTRLDKHESKKTSL